MNSLSNESSPYLLQHAQNPVDWMPWEDKAWEKAREENKLVLVSIGYSACHWCHVMEHESFEDDAVAKIMNDHFVNIKVDREERPDVDQVYMDAAQIITGRGGWPLNVICLPDGRPVYAGTYFPKDHWKQLLLYFEKYYRENKAEALQNAEEITRGIGVLDILKFAEESEFTKEDRETVFRKIDATWDYEFGGRKGAPKFMMPAVLECLLQYYSYSKNAKALVAVTTQLNAMMNGGLYDQVGGGFARYSVDDHWEIPHFEKMLYDNAQLVSVYANAYRVSRNPRYEEVVRETLEFMERELMHGNGGCYSALDADSEGREGEFYVWEFAELKELLQNDFKEFRKVFEVSEEGNFEGKNNLVRIPDVVSSEQLKEWKKLLLSARSKRIRPALDDKMLCSWNALALKAYTDACLAFGEQKYLDKATALANFILANFLQKDGNLKRSFKNGIAKVDAFLDDYALLSEALIALYSVGFSEKYIIEARALCDAAIRNFYDEARGIFYYTSSESEKLIARKTETQDNVIPASNSVLAKVLQRLGIYFEDDNYSKIAKQLLLNMKETVIQYPSFYANWAGAMNWFIDPPYEVAVVGSDAAAMNLELQQRFLPNTIFSGSIAASDLPLLKGKTVPGKTLIYVCEYGSCKAPVEDVATAYELLKVIGHSNP